MNTFTHLRLYYEYIRANPSKVYQKKRGKTINKLFVPIILKWLQVTSNRRYRYSFPTEN